MAHGPHHPHSSPLPERFQGSVMSLHFLPVGETTSLRNTLDSWNLGVHKITLKHSRLHPILAPSPSHSANPSSDSRIQMCQTTPISDCTVGDISCKTIKLAESKLIVLYLCQFAEKLAERILTNILTHTTYNAHFLLIRQAV